MIVLMIVIRDSPDWVKITNDSWLVLVRMRVTRGSPYKQFCRCKSPGHLVANCPTPGPQQDK